MESESTLPEAAELDSIGQINQIDFNQLSAALAKALSEQIGGEFTVHLQRFDRGQATGLAHEMSVEFRVTDHTPVERYSASREGRMLLHNSH